MRFIKKISDLIEDWKFLINRDGFVCTIPIIWQDIIRIPYRHLKFFVFERPLDQVLPDLHPRITLEIRPINQLDLKLIEQMDRPSEARHSQLHLKSGHKGLIAFHQGQPVGYGWGCADVNPEIEKVPIQLEKGDVLCTDVFTNPVFRGQGVQTALSLARFRMFQELGFTRAICYIGIQNAPSLAVWERKLGGKKIEVLDFVRIGPWYKVQFIKLDPGVE